MPDGTYNVQFNLYYVSTGGSSQWTETRTNQGGTPVTIQNGYYSVYLGEVTAFPGSIDWSEDLYLGMTVRGTGSCAFGACTPADAEMTPRFKLTAVPYALRASNVASSNTNAASSNTDNISITTGDALGATSNSGSISLNVGSATGTQGAINIGNGTNAPSSILIGQSGVTTTNGGALTVTQLLTANGGLTISGGTTNGVYYRDGSGNVVTTAAGSTNECFRATTGAAPAWGSCSGTGDIIQGGNSFTAAMRIGTNDAFDLQLEVADTVALTIDDATLATTLAGALTVGGNLTLDPTNKIIFSDTTSGDVTLLEANQSTSGSRIVSSGSFNQELIVDLDYNSSSNFDAFAIRANGTTNRLVVDNTGNVGIGISGTAGALLSVGGTTGNFQVASNGAVTAVGVNSGTGLIQGTGGVTVTGTTEINATGAGTTTIGNAFAGALVLQSASTITTTLADNIADAFDLQEGANNYFNINTTDASENISFGNATTNPSYSFLGTGQTSFGGDIVLGAQKWIGGDQYTNLLNHSSAGIISLNAAGNAYVNIDQTTIQLMVHLL